MKIFTKSKFKLGSVKRVFGISNVSKNTFIALVVASYQ